MNEFKSILVVVNTKEPHAAVTRATELAIENNARLTLMDVIKPLPQSIRRMTDVASPQELERLIVEDRRRQLREIAAEISDTAVPLSVHVATGDPATEITRHVIDANHDLVVKTADGFSGAGRLFGSVAKSLMRLCPCPVWFLKPEIHGEFDQVLAAIDVESGDAAHHRLNQQILELAYSIAQRDKAQFHLVAAWDLWMEQSMRRHAGDNAVNAILKKREENAHQSLNQLMRTAHIETDDVHVHLKNGSAPEAIRAVADEVKADLLVMGTVCRTGISGFLIGNTAETVIPDACCSLLTLKPDGFVSPVEKSAQEPVVPNAPLTLV
ncbi:MAG: universal stress protein [Planctomycetota bacterium]